MMCSVQAPSRQSDRGTVDESSLCSQCVPRWSTDSGAHIKSNFENFWKQINTSLTGDQCRWKSEITHNPPTQTMKLQRPRAGERISSPSRREREHEINRGADFTEQEVELF
ncbi:hypothetical protein KUCAC02_011488 [Chaenocephalus aceratus]|uniref:Uncharacterized protein n=1 Tax=Chaenocephalus aceratus TaxID=36190 RepID=A0ACB9WWT0_CHAAC|nr:hypothetical protein KUCAC02_011488 [Chaenocephalus aceratus]